MVQRPLRAVPGHPAAPLKRQCRIAPHLPVVVAECGQEQILRRTPHLTERSDGGPADTLVLVVQQPRQRVQCRRSDCPHGDRRTLPDPVLPPLEEPQQRRQCGFAKRAEHLCRSHPDPIAVMVQRLQERDQGGRSHSRERGGRPLTDLPVVGPQQLDQGVDILRGSEFLDMCAPAIEQRHGAT